MYHNLPAEKYNDLLFFEPFQERKMKNNTVKVE